MRMALRVTLCLVFMLMAAQARAQTNQWRGIVPLRSTRADVERLLGGPPNLNGWLYDLPDAEVAFTYSTGSCKEGESVGWNVPRDTVVGIHLSLKKWLPLSDLHLDLSKYRRYLSGDSGSLYDYENEEAGVIITVDEEIRGEKKVREIRYVPTANDKPLGCPAPPAKQPCARIQGQP